MAKENKIDAYANALKRGIETLGQIKGNTFLRFTVIIIVIISSLFAVNIIINKDAFATVVEQILKVGKEEREDMKIRDMISPKVQRHLLNLVYSLNCDRAFVIELHNGTRNATDLPFKFFDMTYEEVNDNNHVKHISQNYTNVMVTHYKLPYYLAQNKAFYGTYEELYKIDSRFAENFDPENKGKFLAIHILRTSNDDIGFFGIEFEDINSMKISKAELMKKVEQESIVFADLLDLGFQKLKTVYDE